MDIGGDRGKSICVFACSIVKHSSRIYARRWPLGFSAAWVVFDPKE